MANIQLPPLALYIHYPWCVKKCPYCDFNSHVRHTDDYDENVYIKALLNDFTNDKHYIGGRQLVSIFIGGGTPSLLSVKSLDMLISNLAKQASFASDIEITLEANPNSSDADKFKQFKALGINRLSIGAQSFYNHLLMTIGRVHSADCIRQAIIAAQDAGFVNFNIDLMYGLKGQTNAEILTDVSTAIACMPSHISFYQLTIEPNTLFYKYPPKLPNHEQLFSAEIAAKDLLARAGYKQYEVSAFAKTVCRHNMNYWEFGDYLGIGAGAHSKVTTVDGVIRGVKPKAPKDYLHKQSITYKSVYNLTFEFMLNALRLKSGFSPKLFSDRTALTLDMIKPKLSKAQDMGLLTVNNNKITPTAMGFNFLNDLQAIFL